LAVNFDLQSLGDKGNPITVDQPWGINLHRKKDGLNKYVETGAKQIIQSFSPTIDKRGGGVLSGYHLTMVEGKID